MEMNKKLNTFVVINKLYTSMSETISHPNSKKSIKITWNPIQVSKSIERDDDDIYVDDNGKVRRYRSKSINIEYSLTITTQSYIKGEPSGEPANTFDLGSMDLDPKKLTLAKLRELSDGDYKLYTWTGRLMFEAKVATFINHKEVENSFFDMRYGHYSYNEH
jgi:hypothetical protein